jgi:deazaflavin-dependent oxidoreductase (nitroreductase family)
MSAMLEKQPSGCSRALFRLPIALYRWRLGWVLGRRFVMIEHIGRKSGLPRHAVVEVVRYDRASGSVVVAAAWGRKADWFRNVLKTPEVTLTLGGRRFGAVATVLDEAAAMQALSDYARRHPLAWRELATLMVGSRPRDPAVACEEVANTIPLVRFDPLQSEAD